MPPATFAKIGTTCPCPTKRLIIGFETLATILIDKFSDGFLLFEALLRGKIVCETVERSLEIGSKIFLSHQVRS